MENHNEPHHLHFVNLEFQSHQRLISNNCLPQKTKVTCKLISNKICIRLSN
ncbi:Uncharacterised protein [Segatella oris]|uniref:Uncharacterized protein n=1 Tax=Segatella oris TaxID=28135 RepID=A0A3S4TCH7_9BACT|nr:Uncharacterised protein [Segatella oris]